MKQLLTVLKTRANDERMGFNRAVCGDSRQQFPIYFERWHSVCRAFLDPGQFEAHLANRLEAEFALANQSGGLCLMRKFTVLEKSEL